VNRVKRLSIIILVCILCSLLAFPASASVNALSPIVSLSFSGSTANCSSEITYMGKDISATMELWQGTTLIAVWFGSGSNSVSISGSASIITGRTYTLKVYGTANGISFEAVPVSRSCP